MYASLFVRHLKPQLLHALNKNGADGTMVAKKAAMAGTDAFSMTESTTLMANEGRGPIRGLQAIRRDVLASSIDGKGNSTQRPIHLHTSPSGVILPEVCHSHTLFMRCSKWGHADASSNSSSSVRPTLHPRSRSTQRKFPNAMVGRKSSNASIRGSEPTMSGDGWTELS